MGQRFTAGTTDPPVVRRVVDKLEGLLQNIRDRRPVYEIDDEGVQTLTRQDTRPKAVAVRYVAQQLGCSSRTVLTWLQLHEGRRNDYEISEDFCDVYERIATELAEVVDSKTFAIATMVTHPQSFAAQKYLLPKLDPWVYGERPIQAQSTRQVADYPSEVFDAMSDADKQRLEDIAARESAHDREVDEILARASKKLKDQEDED